MKHIHKYIFVTIIALLLTSTLQAAPKAFDSLGNELEALQKDCDLYLKDPQVSKKLKDTCKKFNLNVEEAFKVGYPLDVSVENGNTDEKKAAHYLDLLRKAEESAVSLRELKRSREKKNSEEEKAKREKKRKEWERREETHTIYKKNTANIEVQNEERQRRITKVELDIDRYRHEQSIGNGNGDSFFDEQISYGVKIQKALIAGKPLIDIPSFVGTPKTLSWAVRERDLEKVKDLLALGADTENWFDSDSPVLRLAVSMTWSANLNEYEQMLSIIYYLLKYGAKIHDDTGWNNLTQAIMNDRDRGTTALTKLFLANGGNVNLSTNNKNLSSGSECSGWFNALYPAVYGKNIELVKLIVESGVDLNRYDDRGFTALDEIYYQLHREYMPYQRKYELSSTDRVYLLSIRDYLISKGAKYRIKSNKR